MDIPRCGAVGISIRDNFHKTFFFWGKRVGREGSKPSFLDLIDCFGMR